MELFIVFIRLFTNLITYNKQLRKAKKLDKAGNVAERDAVVVPLVQKWARYVVSLTGSDTKITVLGAENVPQDSACVFIGNHQGLFDIPLLLGYIEKPKAFIAKAEILKVPILSSWMKLMQCTFLVRNNPRQSVAAMNEAVENAKKGYSLVIFPEGHRSKGGPMQDFKPGSFKLAFRSGLPIVPFTIDGTWHMYEEKGLHAANVTLTIHPPVPTAGITREEQQAIVTRVQQTVKSAITG